MRRSWHTGKRRHGSRSLIFGPCFSQETPLSVYSCFNKALNRSPPSQLTELKLPELPALHYGRCMWDASGSLLMFLWPPEEDFWCRTHNPCQNNQRQGNAICEARDHWFLMNKRGDLRFGRWIKRRCIGFAVYLFADCWLWVNVLVIYFFVWCICTRAVGDGIEVLLLEPQGPSRTLWYSADESMCWSTHHK